MTTRCATLRALHHGRPSGDPLVLPNIWDADSARVFADAGFPALATSSGAVAATLGYADGEHTPADEMFAAIARIVRAVDIPVTADIEAGYRLAPKEIAERLLEAGAAGCNLEDSVPGPRPRELREPAEQGDRLAEVRAASGSELVINARIDSFLFGDRTPASAAERGRHYARAGVDCVYPILAPPESLPEIAQAVDVALNALYLPEGPTPSRLGELGATRVTYGELLYKRATAPTRKLAHQIATAAGSGLPG
ncbi:isocitrate lyase/PEP mutase family protein [Salinactinospora qingdaonensis]|uniref:Isocitrate lyase/phosphoenolpyruvate mutase family protein n=1 Tax=Salinactinospora qingdaonensis TaxID=702744 RepID=A0ABP7EWN2_9ACTN